ncbi:cell surface glycoprotein CD200 receptor 1 isoform X1 [Lagopus muta]|uniref:cell surface glycoprotein CD200 receptor 1 isoform X1 n=2 Tax=Lagopus muta TaxID=64668 RepID=UPI0020A16823|nr:cell surface glycoprotein CD200 receptor 1 isoform X1 [Lagopus muta]
MGNSQQAGWCKKPASPMKTRAALEVVRSTTWTIVLLTSTAVTGATGINRVSAHLGHSAVMTCSNKTNITMVTWKTSPKTGRQCTLAYLIDSNKTEKINCSDRINWRSRPDWDHALEIQQVAMADEGNYTCEVVNADGNFHNPYHLTVLVYPRMALYCDDHGNPVCEAETEKPAAEISWVPQSNSTPRADSHSNGTVTVLSRFAARSSDGKNATCIVSHTTLNETKSIDCSSPHRYLILCIAIVLSFLIIIIFAAVIYCLKLHGYRFCRKTKPPDIVPTYPLQDDTVEVEPYTTYVQKENAIYNSVSDLTLRQNLPQGQLPAT